MTVVPYIREATAYAIEGDATASAAAMSTARNRLDQVRGDDEDSWMSFVRPGELDNIEAATLMRLGQNRRAEALWERAIVQHDSTYLRNRAISWIRLGVTRLELSEVAGAGVAAGKALDDLSAEVESHVATTELDALAVRLAPHRSVPEADAFIGRYLERV